MSENPISVVRNCIVSKCFLKIVTKIGVHKKGVGKENDSVVSSWTSKTNSRRFEQGILNLHHRQMIHKTFYKDRQIKRLKWLKERFDHRSDQ